MKRYLILILVLIIAVFAVSCKKGGNTNVTPSSATTSDGESNDRKGILPERVENPDATSLPDSSPTPEGTPRNVDMDEP